MLEHSPYCERDLRRPKDLITKDEKGDFLMMIKKEGMMHHVIYGSHPFDVVGWDGYNYPYAFSIHDFEPITGRIHQPPPVHQTLKQMLLLFVLSALGYMIITLILYQLHIITAI